MAPSLPLILFISHVVLNKISTFLFNTTDILNRQGTHVESLIQVCYDLSSERTLKRETDSLIECAGELKCSNLLIITMNEERTIEKNGHTIKVVPINKF